VKSLAQRVRFGTGVAVGGNILYSVSVRESVREDNEPPPLSVLVETVDCGLVVLDADGQITWTNTAFSELLGAAESDVCGQSLTSLVGANEGGSELEATDAWTKRVPLTNQIELASGAYGELTLRELDERRYLGRLRDISEQVQAEQELEQYRTMLDSVEDVIYMTDANRQFTWINTAAEDLLGYDRETLLGQSVLAFLNDEQVERAKQNVEYLLSAETPDVLTFEMDVARKDGTTFPAETRATLLPGEGFTGTVGTIRDVSQRKERERELRRTNDRLETFANTISHDLRNPLTIALTRYELAEEECDSEHLQAIGTALERMDVLVDDLYALALHGQQAMDVEAIDLAAIAEAAWQTIPTAQAELRVEDTAKIEADPSRLQQALENLFNNAVEHADSPVTVRVGELEEAGFYVADDGPGIPSETRDQVFDAGYTTNADGTGLGLNIVDEIARAHDWEVAVTDVEDGGARFEIAGVAVENE
jgi:PAS domain S-box-containing protein